MSSLIESEAHFSKRATEVRLSAASLEALRSHGFSTLGQLAYAVGQPGQVIPEAEFSTWSRTHVPAASAGSASYDFRSLSPSPQPRECRRQNVTGE